MKSSHSQFIKDNNSKKISKEELVDIRLYDEIKAKKEKMIPLDEYLKEKRSVDNLMKILLDVKDEKAHLLLELLREVSFVNQITILTEPKDSFTKVWDNEEDTIYDNI